MRKLFGTDGIRGKANTYPLTIEVCLKLAEVLGHRIHRNYSQSRGTVLIGKDTRVSSNMFESAFAAAFSSFGIDVELIGVCPTPAVSVLVESQQTDFGIMISASHNPFSDNGIKIFNKDGFKLSSAEESELETMIFDSETACKKYTDEKIGRIKQCSGLLDSYIKKIVNSVCFKGASKKIVVDAANGSFSGIASKIFRELNCDVISVHDDPDGTNINASCGATHPEEISALVLRYGADIGIAFDGDGDRVIISDERGEIIDGDYILAALTDIYDLKAAGVVSTIMANYGLEQYLKSKEIPLFRTNVGDKYVSEKMRETGAICGGESSGHIIIREHAVTGDGLFTALKIAQYLVDSEKQASSIKALFKKAPSVSRNVTVKDKSIINSPKIADCIDDCARKLQDRGKLIVRASGTENVVRITAEGDDDNELKSIVDSLYKLISSAEGQ